MAEISKRYPDDPVNACDDYATAYDDWLTARDKLDHSLADHVTAAAKLAQTDAQTLAALATFVG